MGNIKRSNAASFQKMLEEIKSKHAFVVDLYYDPHHGFWMLNTSHDGMDEFDSFDDVIKRIDILSKEELAIARFWNQIKHANHDKH